jgi:hypothetical protein
MGRIMRPEGVALTGWLCAVTGGLTMIFGAVFALVGALARALAQQGSDIFAQAGAALDPLSRALLDHFEAVAAVFIIFGLVSLIIGVQFLRMRPAARVALEILAWVVLGATVLLESATLTVWKQEGDNPGGNWISSPITSLLLSLLQVLACILIIRFVRSPAVRTAFRREAPDARG